MSVVSGKVIFCEGKEKSLDMRLLDRVVENLKDRPTIVPAGSKFTLSVFAQGYFSRASTNRKGIIFRDRDFDTNPTDKIQLLELKQMFLSHRACVENYLLNADLIDAYWVTKYREKQDNPTSKWGHKNSPGIEDISAWIENAAKSLLEYQAVRWALADLLQSSTSRTQLKTTWTGGSGKLPQSLALPDCKTAAVELINQFRQAVETVTQEKFEASVTRYQQLFKTDTFWEQKQYLIWFHGKDIQKAMQLQKSQYISLNNFFPWAINQLDITQHPDIVELQEKIQQP
jgi:hypothetical protein